MQAVARESRRAPVVGAHGVDDGVARLLDVRGSVTEEKRLHVRLGGDLADPLWCGV